MAATENANMENVSTKNVSTDLQGWKTLVRKEKK